MASATRNTSRAAQGSKQTDSELIRTRQPITAQFVTKHALDTFGTVEKAEHWLNRPNPLLHGKTPFQIMQADPSGVEAALVRIDHGVYA